jgi:hypothetical protein
MPTTMKIFEDPPLPGRAQGSSSTLSPLTKTRKTVSFAGHSKTPLEDSGSIKTPFRNTGNSQQSPGRTPKIVKSSNMTVATFRQNLKTPPAVSDSRSKLGHWDDKENAYSYNQWSIEEEVSKTFTHKKTSDTTMEITTPNLPTSASSFRRTLRATIDQGNGLNKLVTEREQVTVSESSDNQTEFSQRSHLISSRIGASRIKGLGPPQRVAPKTPNSLLRTEMEKLDSSNASATDGDESLLLSPPPGAVWNALNLSNTRVSTTTGLVMMSPDATAKLQMSSSQQNLSEENLAASPQVLDVKESHFGNISPTIHGTALSHTPPASIDNEREVEVHMVDCTENVKEHLNDGTIHNVERNSRGGIAMDLSRIFSLKENHMTLVDRQNLNVKHSVAPLSASLPAALLAKLNANHQGCTTEAAFQNDLSFSCLVVPGNHYARRARKDSGLEQRSRYSNAQNRNNDESITMGETSNRASRLDSKLTSYESGQSKELSLRKRLLTTRNGQQCVETSSGISVKGGMAFEAICLEKRNSNANGQNTGMRQPTVTVKPNNTSNEWADKQCATFVGWLNYTFNPEEDGHSDETVPTSGLRGLLIHRRLAAARSKAKDLFHSESMRNSRMILLREISSGRLAIRKDRDMTADVQLRKQFAALLLSYTTPWLRMGLEVMFDETIEPVPIMQNGPKVCLLTLLVQSFIPLINSS